MFLDSSTQKIPVPDINPVLVSFDISKEDIPIAMVCRTHSDNVVVLKEFKGQDVVNLYEILTK